MAATNGSYQTVRSYRFYFLLNDHIKAVETRDCADDANATVVAGTLLDERSAFDAIEVWSGRTFVHRKSRGQ